MEAKMNEFEGNDDQHQEHRDIQQSPPPIEGGHQAIDGSAGGNHGDHKKRNWPQHIEAACAILLVIITGTYTYYAAGQLHKMKRAVIAAEGANDIARDALITGQRAYISFKSITNERGPFKAPQSYYWRVGASFINLGNTPAVRAVLSLNDNFLPDEPSDSMFERISRTKLSEDTIGSKSPMFSKLPKAIREEDLFESNLPRNLMQEVGRQTAHVTGKDLSIWGWVAYGDVFNKTPVHLTEFCHRITGISLSDDRIPGLGFQSCKEHNCTDERCGNYKSIIEALEGP
jgi:hypothetical protein